MNRLNISPTEFITQNAAGTRTFDSEYSYIKVKPGGQLIPDFNGSTPVAMMDRNNSKTNRYGFWVGNLPEVIGQTLISRTINLPRSTRVFFDYIIPGIPYSPSDPTIPGEVKVKYNGVLLETRTLEILQLIISFNPNYSIARAIPKDINYRWELDLTPGYSDTGGNLEITFSGLDASADDVLACTVSTVHEGSFTLGVG